jgi:hypothetical protein
MIVASKVLSIKRKEELKKKHFFYRLFIGFKLDERRKKNLIV